LKINEGQILYFDSKHKTNDEDNSSNESMSDEGEGEHEMHSSHNSYC